MTNEQLVECIRSGKDVQENTLALWNNNKGIVYKIAKRFRTYVEMEDLLQESFVGLLEAVKRFDTNTGVKFITYFYYWVVKSMQMCLERYNSSAVIPRYMYARLFQYKKFLRMFEEENNRRPDIEEVAKALEITEQQVEMILRAVAVESAFSFEYVFDADGEYIESTYFMAENNLEDQAVRKTDLEEVKKIMLAEIFCLNDRYAKFARSKYFMNRSTTDAGTEIGASVTRASQINTVILRKLRNCSGTELMKMYFDEYL